MTPSDPSLLEDWRARRDAEAFNEIVSRHAGMVFATSKRILGNDADAEEVAQECFLQLARGEVEIRTSLAGWLHCLARHRSLDLKKRELRRRRREDLYARTAAAPRGSDWESIRPLVDQAIDALPEAQRSVIVAHFLERETYDALARRLGLTRAQVTYRIQLGIEAVRKHLRRAGVPIGASLLASVLATRMVEAAPARILATLGKVALAGTADAVPGHVGTPALVSGYRALPGPAAGRPRAAATFAALAFGAAAIILGTLFRFRSDRAPVEPLAERTAAGAPAATPARPLPSDEVRAGAREATPPRVDGAVPPRPAVSLTGRVVARVGRDAAVVVPAEGVAVKLMPHPRRGKPDESPPPARRVTGTDGSFSFTGIPCGPWFQIEIDPPGGALVTLSFGLKHAEGRESIDLGDIAVEPAVQIILDVVGPEGEPVEKAQVLANREGDPRLQALGVLASQRQAIEVERGRYVVERMPPGPPRVQVVAAGYARFLESLAAPVLSPLGPPEGTVVLSPLGPPEGTVVLSPLGPPEGTVGGAPIVIRLERGRSIAGTVSARDGSPIADARLEVSGPRLGLPLPITRSDGGGRFSFEILNEGEYTLSARAEGYVELKVGELRPGGEEVDLVLEPEALCTGRAIAEGDRSPVAGARVTLKGAAGDFQAETDGLGRFRVRGIAPGSFTLFVDREDFALLAGGPFAFEPGREVSTGDLALRRGVTASGALVDARTEAPIAGARIGARPGARPGSAPGGSRSAVTLADGTFTLRGLSPGEYTFDVKARGFLGGRFESVEVGAAGLPGLDLALEPGSSVSGRVVDARGAPVAGATVRFTCTLVRPEEWDPLKDILRESSAQTDAEGRFTAAGLPPRAGYVAVATHRDQAPGSLWGIDLREGESLEGLTLKLTPGGAIRGRVADAEGRGIAGVRVTARPGMGAGERSLAFAASATSGPEGRYTIPHLSPGAYALAAYRPGLLPPNRSEVQVTEGETAGGVDLVLRAGEALQGRVIDSAGRAVAGAEVLATAGASCLPGERTGADGRFEIRGLAAGTLALLVEKPGFARREIEAAVPSPAELVIPLVAAARIRGRIRGFSEALAKRVHVVAWNQAVPGNRAGAPARAGSRGEFSIEVEPGAYLLEVVGSGLLAGRSRRITVAAGEVIDGVEVDLAAQEAFADPAPSGGLRLRGLLRLDGIPPSEGWILFCPEDGAVPPAGGAIDASSSFQLELPGPGRFHVLLARGDGTGACNWVSVPPGQSRLRMDIDLPTDGIVPLLGPERP